MKEFFKLSTAAVSLFFLSVLLFPSCVAKKKFISMEESRNRAEQRVRKLTDEVDHLQSDFDIYQNEFQFNSAVKDSYIDSLNKVVVGLNSVVLSKNENIEDQQLSDQIEKRRLNQLLANRDLKIRDLELQLSDLQNKVSSLMQEQQEMVITHSNLSSNVKSLEFKLNQKELEITKQNGILNKGKADITLLKEQLVVKDEKISALENQVKLLKSQFGEK
jgi:chromosome segregation ATPase